MAKKSTKPSAPNKNGQAKDVVLHEWRATKRELGRVTIGSFNGRTFIHIRRWYRDAQGELCPGMGISVEPPNLRSLWKALRKADRRINGRQ
jgi:Transcriptional Coactivator p15 (PC4)